MEQATGGGCLSFLDSTPGGGGDVFSSNSYIFQLTRSHLHAVHLLQDNSFILYQQIFLFLETAISLFT